MVISCQFSRRVDGCVKRQAVGFLGTVVVPALPLFGKRQMLLVTPTILAVGTLVSAASGSLMLEIVGRVTAGSVKADPDDPHRAGELLLRGYSIHGVRDPRGGAPAAGFCLRAGDRGPQAGRTRRHRQR